MNHSNISTAVLFGSGNVGTHLGRALAASGVKWLQVFSKTMENAAVLAHRLGAEPITEVEKADQKADLWLIAVSDEAIAPLVERLPPFRGIVAHTAGSISLEVLSKFNFSGVFYPFQTFSKEVKLNPVEIPVLIEGSDGETKQRLLFLARLISAQVIEASSKQRVWLHLTGVFSSNFANHLYALSEELLSRQNLPFNLLAPLIQETTRKALSMPPASAQTGPAVRNDRVILTKHLQMLSEDEKLQEIYRVLSNHILAFHGHGGGD